MYFIEELLSQQLSQSASKKGIENIKFNIQPCSLPIADYQCNDCMSLAKIYHKSPIDIAKIIIQDFSSEIVDKVEVCSPGYINFTISQKFLSNYLVDFMNNYEKEIVSRTKKQKIIVDYGGANVAKPLHVGHLRSANIGESIKRICQYVGCDTLGDVHLGDWGLQMGMVIAEIESRQPDLVYFDSNYKGSYPTEPPITIKDLETLYPQANAKAKQNEEFMQKAKQTTVALQNGNRGYRALWKHIVNISVQDLKKNYDALNVHFDLWLGESDTQKDYDYVIDYFVKNNLAKQSEGALVVDISSQDDKKEMPPFMLKKSDGGVLYSTTDLATLYDRVKNMKADKVIYVADNRQELHFTQLFRIANKFDLLPNKVELHFAGFGTMNGVDGKPYKTRDGGVMKLQDLIKEVKDSASKMSDNTTISDTVAISALKFADLSIMRTKDYIFDPDKFCAFDGKTGPYLLYSLTRAKSIIRKFNQENQSNDFSSSNFDAKYCDKDLIFCIINFAKNVLDAYSQLSPNILCDYAYKLASTFSASYSKINILKQTDNEIKNSLIYQTQCYATILEKTLNLLAINTLEKM